MSNDIVNIKGTNKGLIIYLDGSSSNEELLKEMKRKIESARGFFKGARFTFHCQNGEIPEETLSSLEEICTANGLTADENITIPQPVKEQLSAALAEDYKIPAARSFSSRRFQTHGLINAEEETPTVFLKHGLRSGQKIHFQGNVTILGDVNAGAEIVATGDIIIMGTLRGIAHAGALGNTNAKIVAYRLQPNQLRIASSIGRSPDQSYAKADYPEIAHITEGNIIIEEYQTVGMKKKSYARR